MHVDTLSVLVVRQVSAFTGDELAADPNTKDIALDPFDERFTFEHFSADALSVIGTFTTVATP